MKCYNANYLVNNLDYLSSLISSTEALDSLIDQERIDRLGSIVVKPKELVVPMQELVMIASVYKYLTRQVLNIASKKIQKMNDGIESDMTNADYVKSKKADIVGDKLTQSCVKVDKAEKYLKEFEAEIEKCKDDFKETVAPQSLKINTGIDDLTTEYNEIDPDVGAARRMIHELIAMILSEMKALKPNTEKATAEFGDCIANKGTECEAYMKGIHNEFKTLLG